MNLNGNVILHIIGSEVDKITCWGDESNHGPLVPHWKDNDYDTRYPLADQLEQAVFQIAWVG